MANKIKYNFNAEEHDSTSKISNFNYVICSTPRSGSTLLSKGLMSTKIAGLPHEYFNEEHKRDYWLRWDFDTIKNYIKLLKKNRVSSNGVFGYKIHYHQYSSEFGNKKMDKYFRELKYIFITRKDKISQGISLEIAHQTNQWSSEFSSDKKAEFRFDNIKKRINEVKYQETKWIQYFKINDINPCLIYYEDLENDYFSSISKVLDYLTLNFSGSIPPIQIQKQRTIKNFIWKKKYLALNLIK